MLPHRPLPQALLSGELGWRQYITEEPKDKKEKGKIKRKMVTGQNILFQEDLQISLVTQLQEPRPPGDSKQYLLPSSS